MGITAKQLAQKLNLSEAAVSMALNNKPGVSTSTRKRVLDAAKEYGYDFSRLAESNFSSSTASMNGTVYFILYRRHGAVVSDTPFFSQLAQGIDEGCKQNHYYLNVSYLYEGDPVSSFLSDILRAGCKGIILLGTEMQAEDLAPFSDLPVPLVLLDTYFESLEANYVIINNIQGAYLACSHLISKYKVQPGYLHSSYSINNFQERADGFYKAIRQSGMSASKSPVCSLSPSIEGAYADMLSLLNQGEEPSRCYFADNDLIACGAIKALQEKGYRIPEDVAVIGFDNMPVASYITPPLTTVHVPKQYLGRIAVDRIHELIHNSDSHAIKIEVSASLIRRKSG